MRQCTVDQNFYFCSKTRVANIFGNLMVLPFESLDFHSMAIGNLNKSKETTPTTTTVLMVAP